MRSKNVIIPKPLPTGFEDVALLDAETAAAIGGMRVSWWYQQLRDGLAPQPAVRKSRCTRWRARDVFSFWAAFADQGTDPQVVERAAVASKKASSPEAQARRVASRKANAEARAQVKRDQSRVPA